MANPNIDTQSRVSRQQARQLGISEAVMAEGSVRIEQLAERFQISVMTVHRDLDELEDRGLLRKSRGWATATSTSLVESSNVYRAGRQTAEKKTIAQAALDHVEPGQAIILDDSTTTLHLVPHLHSKAPLTIITNTLTIINELTSTRGLTLIGLGGEYYNWCSSFMGRITVREVEELRADVFFMSTSAIVDDICFHQTLETVDVKRAMFESASKRVLLVDGTKFEKRALHAMLPLADFDAVIVDSTTHSDHISRLRDSGVNVQVARRPG
jgi:DeoR/GlpR family transcriptional regulator of sugar metabolism